MQISNFHVNFLSIITASNQTLNALNIVVLLLSSFQSKSSQVQLKYLFRKTIIMKLTTITFP